MRPVFPFVLCAAFMAMPAITGCDREVAHETKTTTNSNGEMKRSDTTVTKNADGTTEKTTTETKVDH